MKETFDTLDEQVERLLKEAKTFEKVSNRIKDIEVIKAKLAVDTSQQEGLLNAKVKEAFPNSASPMSLVQLLFNRTDFEWLEVQKEEYIKLAMDLDESAKMMDLLDYELTILIRKVERAQGVEQELNELLRHRADVFNIDDHQELAVLVERIDNLSTLVIEIVEAISAAVELERLLKKAETWQSRRMRYFKKIDVNNAMMLEMSLSKMRDFRDMSVEIKRRFRILEGELNDILNHSGLITLKHHKYSEYFLQDLHEALLDDLHLEANRTHTQSYLHSHITHIRRILSTMRKDRNSTRKKITALKKKRDKLVYK